jgi:hypothetical protein
MDAPKAAREKNRPRGVLGVNKEALATVHFAAQRGGFVARPCYRRAVLEAHQCCQFGAFRGRVQTARAGLHIYQNVRAMLDRRASDANRSGSRRAGGEREGPAAHTMGTGRPGSLPRTALARAGVSYLA